MDLGKVGQYIAKKRQEMKMTQLVLSEKLNVNEKLYLSGKEGLPLPIFHY